eukprot:scaffold229453_cov15-Tisochrysis_lutea.AAC.1
MGLMAMSSGSYKSSAHVGRIYSLTHSFIHSFIHLFITLNHAHKADGHIHKVIHRAHLETGS